MLLDVLVLAFTILIVLRLMQLFSVLGAHAFIDRFAPCSWANQMDECDAAGSMAGPDA